MVRRTEAVVRESERDGVRDSDGKQDLHGLENEAVYSVLREGERGREGMGGRLLRRRM